MSDLEHTAHDDQPATSWAVWAWAAYQDGRLVELDARSPEAALNACAERDDMRDRLADVAASATELLDFYIRHSNRWDGINGRHPALVVADALAALQSSTPAEQKEPKDE